MKQRIFFSSDRQPNAPLRTGVFVLESEITDSRLRRHLQVLDNASRADLRSYSGALLHTHKNA